MTVVIALVVSGSAFFGLRYAFDTPTTDRTLKIEHVDRTPAQSVLYTRNEEGDMVPLDFTLTAETVKDAVVHITSTQTHLANGQNPFGQQGSPFGNDFFERFFGPNQPFAPQPPQQGPARVGTGSGVIIRENGYIVTNNHVIENADDIEVALLDNRTYKATLVGTDPTTDLALLKIEDTDLPVVKLTDSDRVRVGQWVMAVGNPFNLNSTVTAGIVSAKGRSINILRNQSAIESFIQTDAAINPGNSGGALVDLEGKLVGINTAIASPTGAYSGYGFAVPSNIVSKVVDDLMEYGVVQRGYLGINIRPVDAAFAKEKELTVNRGVYIDGLSDTGSAGLAGMQQGDVIIEADGVAVNTNADLLEVIAQRRPGDALNVVVDRFGTEKRFDVTLNNRDGNTEVVTKAISSDLVNLLGATFETINETTARQLEIKGGVKVTELRAGKLQKQTNMQEGFIITKVDGKTIKSTDDLFDYLENKRGGVMLEGVYENYPGAYYYAFGM